MNDILGLTLARAIKALQNTSKSELEELPLPGCAFMLSVLPDKSALTKLRHRLAGHVRHRLSLLWIEEGDLYEVFSVLAALWHYSPGYVSGEQLAGAVQRLVKSEVAVGGPYSSDGSISVTANTQIALFMRLVAKPLPKLQAYLAEFITAGRFKDTELSEPALLYWLAQACDSPALTRYVAHHWQQSAWRTPWRTAVALIILKDEVPASEATQALAFLCEQQQSTGFWEGESLLGETSLQTSSRFTTTALIAKTLTDYEPAPDGATPLDIQQKQQAVARDARRLFSGYAEPLRSRALAMTEQMCSGTDNSLEIMLLPHFFAQALKTPAPLSDQQVTVLGVANVCAWLAYTIYDNFLDDEGTPAQLPVANIAMRAALDCFKTAVPGPGGFQQYVAKTFTAMDEVNAWELSECHFSVQAGTIVIPRLPRYGDCAVLAARSFAHALGPMALVQSLPSGSKADISRIESGFRHFLIARQLNDDMYDWQDDMQAGQVTYVVAAILRDMQIKPGTYTLSSLIPAMQKRFRQTTMPKVAKRMSRHIARSREAFAKSQLLRPVNDIYALLDKLDLSVEQSLDKRAKGQALAVLGSELSEKR